MPTEPRANTPLWLDLLLLSGVVGAAYGLERLIPSRRPPPGEDLPDTDLPEVNRSKGNGAAAPALSERRLRETASGPKVDEAHHDNEGGAMGVRPSQEPESVQHARAWDRKRGRRARSPMDIPAKGWLDVGWRVYRQMGEDRVLAVAAGAVFYMLLALFPAIAALVSLYGLYNDPSTINDQLSLLYGFMPAAGLDMLRDQVTRLVETSSRSLSFGFLVGLALTLWSTNAGMKGVIDALNVVYDEREKRGFIKLTLVAFAFTLGAMAFILFALSAIVVLPLVLAWAGFGTHAGWLLGWVRWPALMIIIMIWLAVLYRYGPSREKAQWKWLSVGSVFGTFAWLIGSALFSWYLSNFANYDATYGSLGAAVGLMMWLWMSVIVILVGGQINAELEHQTAEDTTTLPEKPLGERGATMADTVGEAWS